MKQQQDCLKNNTIMREWWELDWPKTVKKNVNIHTGSTPLSLIYGIRRHILKHIIHVPQRFDLSTDSLLMQYLFRLFFLLWQNIKSIPILSSLSMPQFLLQSLPYLSWGSVFHANCAHSIDQNMWIVNMFVGKTSKKLGIRLKVLN